MEILDEGGKPVTAGVFAESDYLGDSTTSDVGALTATESATITVRLFNQEGKEISRKEITVNNGDNLSTIAALLDNLDGVSAGLVTGERVSRLRVVPNPEELTGAWRLELEVSGDGKISLNKGAPISFTQKDLTYRGSLFVRRGAESFFDSVNTSPEAVANAYMASDSAGTVIHFYDENGVAVAEKTILIDSGETLGEVMAKLNKEGLNAQLDEEGHLVISLRTWTLPPEDPRRGAAFFVIKGLPNFSDGSKTVSWSETNPRLADYERELNALDLDGDGAGDFSAGIDEAGRFRLALEAQAGFQFALSSNAPANRDPDHPTLSGYLLRRVLTQNEGLSNHLQGFEIRPGDNRTARLAATLSDRANARLGNASLPDYYSSLVGEIGVGAKTVKRSRTFMEDLLAQLQVMRDSISGVSLDEELANLVKYQQAYAAASKILTVSDEMLDRVIEMKR